jgi:4-amino-4-deoxy-L-arabinose transferase-like glycosyltransferase
VTFAFFFIIALAAVVHALGRRSIAAAILTGLAVGLAWLTKYHGWFVLVIAAMALLLFAWRRRLNRISIMRLLFLWAIIALVAAMCYLPWALYIQSQPGGYTALAKYQRTMLDPHWFRNLWQQIRMQFFFEGALSRSSVLLAFLCVLLVSPGSSLPKHRFLLVLGLLLVSALLIGASGTAVLLTLLAVPALLRKPVSFQGCVILAWLALWFLSAPLYHPYARLILPFMIAAYLTGGYWMSAALEKSEQNLRSPAWHYLAVPAALLVVIAVSVFLPHASNPWRNSRSVANTARAMEKFVPPGSRVIVIGEPALAYYLHLAGRPAFETTNDTVARLVALEKLGAPVYLVAGVYSNRAPPLKKGLEKLQNRLTLIKTFPMEPKDLRVLDDFAPRDARLFRQNPDRTYDLCLYRYSP